MNDPDAPKNTDLYAEEEKPIWLYLARFENETGILTLSEDGQRQIALHGEMVIVSSGQGRANPWSKQCGG